MYGADRNLAARLADQATAARGRLAAAGQRIDQLTADLTVTAQPNPAGWLTAAHTTWTSQRAAAAAAAHERAARQAAQQAEAARRRTPSPGWRPDGRGRGIGR